MDKGIESESYFIALSDKGFQNKKGMGLQGQELKNTQMKKRKTELEYYISDCCYMFHKQLLRSVLAKAVTKNTLIFF